MLERFGDGALREVELRISELTEHDELEAAALWQQVFDALLDLGGGGADQTRH